VLSLWICYDRFIDTPILCYDRTLMLLSTFSHLWFGNLCLSCFSGITVLYFSSSQCLSPPCLSFPTTSRNLHCYRHIRRRTWYPGLSPMSLYVPTFFSLSKSTGLWRCLPATPRSFLRIFFFKLDLLGGDEMARMIDSSLSDKPLLLTCYSRVNGYYLTEGNAADRAVFVITSIGRQTEC